MSERVPSWAATDEQLAGFGFPVRKTDKIMGSVVVVREGMPRSRAVMAAWRAGFVRIESSPVTKALVNRPDSSWAEIAREMGFIS